MRLCVLEMPAYGVFSKALVKLAFPDAGEHF